MNKVNEIFNFLEEELRNPSIFINESKLSSNYVPKELLHREKQLKMLSNVFKSTIDDPGGASRQVIIYGPVGSGKTAVIKRFLAMLKDTALKRGINLKHVHVNCRINKTAFLILKSIIRSFDKKIPERGLSSEELMQILNQILENDDIFLVIVLDEVDDLKKPQLEIIYYLSRIIDTKLNPLHRLSLILIARSIDFLNKLDAGTLSSLQNNLIYFQKYSQEELIDIINSRIEEVFYEDVVAVDSVMMISELVEDLGDIRVALELLWKAGKEADSQNLFKILPEFVLKYKSDMNLYDHLKRRKFD